MTNTLYTCSLVMSANCKLQYVGKAVDDFRLRSNNYKDNSRKNVRKESCRQQHFSSECQSGFLEDVSIIFIGKTDLLATYP